MAGVLDNKSRVIDAIVTNDGRRQLASGMLQAKFVSFTDRNFVYSKDSDGYLEDPGLKIYFEASSNDSDQIVPETDNDGNLAPYRSDSYDLTNGRVPLSAMSQSMAVAVYESVTSTSAENFKRQMIIGSRDTLRQNLSYSFKISNSNPVFYITENLVSQSNGVTRAYVDDIESVFQDYRFGNMDNYKFLPPVDRPIDIALAPQVMASYTQINENPLDTFSELDSYLMGKQSSIISFDQTSVANNLISQMFEHGPTGLEKLSIIDAGQFEVDGKTSPQVYFAGKLYRDSAQNLNFVNIFTLVFE